MRVKTLLQLRFDIGKDGKARLNSQRKLESSSCDKRAYLCNSAVTLCSYLHGSTVRDSACIFDLMNVYVDSITHISGSALRTVVETRVNGRSEISHSRPAKSVNLCACPPRELICKILFKSIQFKSIQS